MSYLHERLEPEVYTAYDAMFSLVMLLYKVNVIGWNSVDPIIELGGPQLVEEYCDRIGVPYVRLQMELL
jgi:hypothetical protein